MGLDISYYSDLKFMPEIDKEKFNNGNYNWDEYVYLYSSPHFYTRILPLKEGTYKGKRHHSFRAGSYSGYNFWRERLSKLAIGVLADVVWKNEDKYENQAFYELINFSDCEGTLGTEVCQKLHRDFVKYHRKIKEQLDINREDDYSDDDVCFWSQYLEWKKAFKYASKNGAVCFH